MNALPCSFLFCPRGWAPYQTAASAWGRRPASGGTGPASRTVTARLDTPYCGGAPSDSAGSNTALLPGVRRQWQVVIKYILFAMSNEQKLPGFNFYFLFKNFWEWSKAASFFQVIFCTWYWIFFDLIDFSIYFAQSFYYNIKLLNKL